MHLVIKPFEANNHVIWKGLVGSQPVIAGPKWLELYQRALRGERIPGDSAPYEAEVTVGEITGEEFLTHCDKWLEERIGPSAVPHRVIWRELVRYYAPNERSAE